ncbi:MAG: DoxX family protein [Bacteroidetes bacterium]|nr:DoxX family protein [Bacteroidota bacterium]
MTERSSFFELNKTHDDVALDIIRGFLGVALFVRGLLFISDSSRIITLVEMGNMDYLVPALLLYAAILTHTMGGLMLAVGLLTRIAALIQIPVLLGAVFIAIIQGGLFLPEQSLELSALVLVLLGILFVFGSGPFSLDRVIFKPGAAASALEREKEESEEYRSRVAEWGEKRAAAAAVAEAAADHGARAATGTWFRAATLLRYGFASGIAGVLLYFAIRSLPFEISLVELAAIGGILFLILGFFFLFFGWALKDDETTSN